MFGLFESPHAAQEAARQHDHCAQLRQQQMEMAATRERLTKEYGLTEADAGARAMLRVWPNGQEDLIIDFKVVHSTR